MAIKKGITMSELNFPDNLLYHTEHTWLRMQDSNIAVVGITFFAQEQLGEVAYVDLPRVGLQYAAGRRVRSRGIHQCR